MTSTRARTTSTRLAVACLAGLLLVGCGGAGDSATSGGDAGAPAAGGGGEAARSSTRTSARARGPARGRGSAVTVPERKITRSQVTVAVDDLSRSAQQVRDLAVANGGEVTDESLGLSQTYDDLGSSSYGLGRLRRRGRRPRAGRDRLPRRGPAGAAGAPGGGRGDGQRDRRARHRDRAVDVQHERRDHAGRPREPDRVADQGGRAGAGAARAGDVAAGHRPARERGQHPYRGAGVAEVEAGQRRGPERPRDRDRRPADPRAHRGGRRDGGVPRRPARRVERAAGQRRRAADRGRCGPAVRGGRPADRLPALPAGPAPAREPSCRRPRPGRSAAGLGHRAPAPGLGAARAAPPAPAPAAPDRAAVPSRRRA